MVACLLNGWQALANSIRGLYGLDVAAPFPDVTEQNVPTLPSSPPKSCQPAHGRYIAELNERQVSGSLLPIGLAVDQWPVSALVAVPGPVAE